MSRTKRRVKKWTDEERQYIIDNYGKVKTKAMAKHLKVTMSQFYAQTSYLRGVGLIEFTERVSNFVYESQKSPAEDELAYKRALEAEKLVQYGIKHKLRDLNLKKGSQYVVVGKDGEGRTRKESFKGVLIREYDDFVVLQGYYKQCFLKVDILIKEYDMRECLQ